MLCNRFKPSSKIFLLTVPWRCVFVDHLCISVLFLLCFCALLLIDALGSPAGKGPTSWPLFVMSNYESVSFPLVSYITCGA